MAADPTYIGVPEAHRVTVTATARAIRFGSDQAVEDGVIEARSSARFKTAQYLASTAGASALIEVEPVEDKISVEQGEFGDKTTVQTLELVPGTDARQLGAYSRN